MIFSIYAKTGASASPEIFGSNDCLLEKIFLIAAQFGDIPVIVAGDFQLNPLSYPSIAHAVHFEGWSDPLTSADTEGRLHRPITFSLDGTFTSEGDGGSSIDGILLNRVAFCALKSIEVIELQGHQHRPVRAVFSWQPIHQVGEIHTKFAALDHTSFEDAASKQPDNVDVVASDLWSQVSKEQFDVAEDFPAKWQAVNDFCLQTLLANGSQWGLGRTRGASCPLLLGSGFALASSLMARRPHRRVPDSSKSFDSFGSLKLG